MIQVKVPFVIIIIFVLSFLSCPCTSNSEDTCEDKGVNGECRKNNSVFILKGGPEDGNIDSSLFEALEIQVEEEASGHHTVEVAVIPEGERVGLQYVRQFLTAKEVSKLIGFCDGRDGWTASPQNQGNGGGVSVSRARTSHSCPLVWPLLYLDRMEEIRARGILTPEIEDEIVFTTDLMKRIATFLNVDMSYIEPLQLLRYGAGQYYKQHHDHGSYYGVNTEQRPHTFLLFLSSVPADDGGGHTKFNQLDIAVLPRSGDGIVWSNVNEENEVLLDAVHEAMPPLGENVIKYAMNVWIGERPAMENLRSSSTYTT